MGWSFRYRTSGMPLGVPSGAVRKVSVTALGGGRQNCGQVAIGTFPIGLWEKPVAQRIF